MTETDSAVAPSPARELTLTRIFDAPRELVFKAWTESERLARWWGPAYFTNPVCRLDPRPGGKIRVDMRGPDGTVYPMGGTFHEIVPFERIVMTTTGHEHEDGYAPLEVLNTVTFADLGGKTQVTLHAVVVRMNPEMAQAVEGMSIGWNQSLDRLDDYVVAVYDESGMADREIVATRYFDAPRELVFKMWTDPEHVAHWWGPNGFSLTIFEMDVRVGGVWRFVMHGPDGTDYQNENHYLEVTPPETLAYAHVSEPRHDMRVTFEESDGKTKLTARLRFESAELREFVEQKFHAVDGLSQTLGRLGEYLPKV